MQSTKAGKQAGWTIHVCGLLSLPDDHQTTLPSKRVAKNWFLRARTGTKQVLRCPETKMRDDALGEEGSLNAPTAHFIMHDYVRRLAEQSDQAASSASLNYSSLYLLHYVMAS